MDTVVTYAKQFLTPIITEKCVKNYFNDMNFMDEACMKLTLSKGLGIGIIAGSMMVKVPQIMKIWGASSAAGITFISVLMELFAITSTMAYSFVSGFPFSSWGEACFLAVQTSIVAYLVLWYNYASTLMAVSFMVGYAASVYGLMFGLTPVDVLWSMQALNVPIIVTSKLIQAVANYRNQSTGQLSAITIFMLFGGSLARIFTSIQETGDMIIIVTYIAASTVNALIAFQMLWYWNSSGKKGSRGGKSGKKGGNKQKKNK